MISRKPMRPEAALIRLEELCARSEQCEWELRRKLRTWQIGERDADTIMRSLLRRRFVDDSRYAVAFTRDKYRFARWGRRKIEMALRQRHVDSDIIDEALDQIDEDEYREALHGILAAKAKKLEEPASYENRTKLFRFALARGFESQLISKVLKNILQ
ncbi:MAG: RecX family transcriptional regulator [Muribaculaceae bacterium]|nr:RecX family transcriptional regulator [Muribaculaceae bacterium]